MIYTDPTNKERAKRIRTILPAYIEAKDNFYPGEESQEDINDLLADVMHYCNEANWDFEEALDCGRINFEAEIAENI